MTKYIDLFAGYGGSMSKFTVTLGNVELRPGHRHDCAQVELTVDLYADDKGAALEHLRRVARRGTIYIPGSGPDGGGQYAMTLTINPDTINPDTINPDTISARTVRVDEQS